MVGWLSLVDAGVLFKTHLCTVLTTIRDTIHKERGHFLMQTWLNMAITRTYVMHRDKGPSPIQTQLNFQATRGHQIPTVLHHISGLSDHNFLNPRSIGDLSQ
ncbi:hypothetical protein HF521_018129 [Silurus meridionalis]|uniref:Uncharacterized protein n=1 Tax=Silurus meridionalis TaxID=175797 RepID=A0A8T0BP54_SILME|nr:hypothetical protein HF521_018129 [Silurus meridionalis]